MIPINSAVAVAMSPRSCSTSTPSIMMPTSARGVVASPPSTLMLKIPRVRFSSALSTAVSVSYRRERKDIPKKSQFWRIPKTNFCLWGFLSMKIMILQNVLFVMYFILCLGIVNTRYNRMGHWRSQIQGINEPSISVALGTSSQMLKTWFPNQVVRLDLFKRP